MKYIHIIISLLILILLVFLTYLGALEIKKIFSSLKPEVAAAIVSSMATVFVGIAAVILNQRHVRQRSIEESHRETKVKVYKKFMDIASQVMSNSNSQVTNKGISQQDLINYMVEYKADLMLWGSPKVIKCQLAYEKAAQEHGESNQDPRKVMFSINNLYKAIREDIGLSNKGLHSHELVKLYLKDPTELD